jgi:hypothetical protein
LATETALAPHQGCDAIGYPRTLTVDLPEPYDGDEIRDMATTEQLTQPPE